MNDNQLSTINDHVVFTRKGNPKYTPLGKSVGIKEDEWLEIRDIAEKSGMTMTDVATELVRFALNYVKWENANEQQKQR